MAGVNPKAVLNSEGYQVFQDLQSISLKEFYLAGGTALAFQLRHRISVDFDFFSESLNLDLGERESIQARFENAKISFVIETDKDKTLELRVKNVRVCFFHYPNRLLAPFVDFLNFKLASLEDIAAMKLAALAGRGLRRDFIDLFFIAKKIPLEKLLQNAAQKYSKTVDFPFQAIKALSYFEEAEQEAMPKLLIPVDWNEIRSFFETESIQLIKRWLK